MKDQKVRLTPARRALAHVFDSTAKPLSAPEILALMEKRGVMVNKTTVYRDLDRLEALGAIRPISLGGRREYYERVALAHHHHLVCLECERIEDIDLDEREILRQERSIGRAHRFTILRHSLEFFGLCQTCAYSM